MIPEKEFVIQEPSSISSTKITQMENIIGQDEGQRGMKCLIVPGDLERAAVVLTNLNFQTCKPGQRPNYLDIPRVILLSGFPCCVEFDPPTETDGPPGAMAIAKCCIALGYGVTLVTDECNKKVFQAAAKERFFEHESFCLCTFPSQLSSKERLDMISLANSCDLIISCERPGPAAIDGICRTMRGIDMNAKRLIAPLHEIVEIAKSRIDKIIPFIAIGDGGNELGMGKVMDMVRERIPNGELIAAVTVADYLITASVSNWGAYALCAACAVMMNQYDAGSDGSSNWKNKVMPTKEDEADLINRCVLAGCRDGVSGRIECTVDGLPLETSLNCLEQLTSAIGS